MPTNDMPRYQIEERVVVIEDCDGGDAWAIGKAGVIAGYDDSGGYEVLLDDDIGSPYADDQVGATYLFTEYQLLHC